MYHIPDGFPQHRLAANMPERLASLDEEVRKSLCIWSQDQIRKMFRGGRYPKDKERQGRYLAGVVRHL